MVGLQSQGGTAAIIENQEIPEIDEDWAGARVWTNEWYTTRTGEITGGTAERLTAEMTASWDRGGILVLFVWQAGIFRRSR